MLPETRTSFRYAYRRQENKNRRPSLHLEHSVEVRCFGDDLAGHGSFQEVIAEEVLHDRLRQSSHGGLSDPFRLESVVRGQERLFLGFPSTVQQPTEIADE